ncbi:MAG TPA: cation ABC transporter substrate-binding protein [Synergistaceae bacterium]|jgi:zinc transport system substrate-binding protein|nr:cation ABC transporter substrate-binding protein [Synergistaceae bacterium]
MTAKKILVTLFVTLIALTGSSAAAGGRLSVFVSILPQKYFAEQIGGDRVTVSALVEKGQDPHTFEPRPAQMAALAEAAAYLSIGMPFEEALLPKLLQLNPGLRLFESDAGVERIMPEEVHHHEDAAQSREHHDEEEHDHEAIHDDHEHHHDGADPHVWNAPREAKIIASNMLRTLTELDPEGADYYSANFAALSSRLDAMDDEFKTLFRGKEGTAFLVFHPGWGYLARQYGLREVAIEVDGKEPKASDMACIVSDAKERGVRILFIAPQFSRRSAETVARAVGASVEVADPLAEEWEANLRRVAQAIADAAR